MQSGSALSLVQSSNLVRKLLYSKDPNGICSNFELRIMRFFLIIALFVALVISNPTSTTSSKPTKKSFMDKIKEAFGGKKHSSSCLVTTICSSTAAATSGPTSPPGQHHSKTNGKKR